MMSGETYLKAVAILSSLVIVWHIIAPEPLHWMNLIQLVAAALLIVFCGIAQENL